jgi:hypothetical protein
VTQPAATTAISSFCASVNQSLSNTTSIYSKDYPIDGSTMLSFGAGWQLGDPACSTGRSITTEECNAQLRMVLNDCDTASVTRKYGGYRINNCVSWMMAVNGTIPTTPSSTTVQPTITRDVYELPTITGLQLGHGPVVMGGPSVVIHTVASGPTLTPVPLPPPLSDTCDVSWRLVYDLVEVRGKAWTTTELGNNGENLKSQLAGCGAITDWNFQLTPDDCCMDWYVSCHLPIGVKNCVGRAVVSAAGSSATVGDCHGAG